MLSCMRALISWTCSEREQAIKSKRAISGLRWCLLVDGKVGTIFSRCTYLTGGQVRDDSVQLTLSPRSKLSLRAAYACVGVHSIVKVSGSC